MKFLLSTIIVLVCVCAQAQPSKDARPFKYFESVSMFYERTLPACTDYNAAGVPNWHSFGMEGEFLCMTFGQWRWKQRISGTFGGANSENLITGIQFEGGHTGAFSVWSSRYTGNVGTVIAFQPTPKLELSIPIMFATRLTTDVGRFHLNDGATVDPAEEVSNHEANSANKVIIDRKWMPGFKTGFEIVGMPNDHWSAFARIDYQYFGWRDVYDISSGRLNSANGTVDFTSDRVWSTPEWGLSLGIRFYFYTVGKSEHKRKDTKDDPNVILEPKKR